MELYNLDGFDGEDDFSGIGDAQILEAFDESAVSLTGAEIDQYFGALKAAIQTKNPLAVQKVFEKIAQKGAKKAGRLVAPGGLTGRNYGPKPDPKANALRLTMTTYDQTLTVGPFTGNGTFDVPVTLDEGYSAVYGLVAFDISGIDQRIPANQGVIVRIGIRDPNFTYVQTTHYRNLIREINDGNFQSGFMLKNFRAQGNRVLVTTQIANIGVNPVEYDLIFKLKK